MALIVRHRVRLQILEAAKWYQSQKKGLGGDFVLAVDEALAAVGRSPLIYPIVHGSARRALMKAFPYAIHFVIRNDDILVFSLTHLSRNPRVWQRLMPSHRPSRN